MKKDDGSRAKVRRIQKGDVVGYRFVIRSETGQILAASTELVHYLQGGDGSLAPIVEEQMEGRQAGETFRAALSARLPPSTLRALCRVTLTNERFPRLFELTPGSRVDTEGPDGSPISYEVQEREVITVPLDFDHPFSERASQFEVSVVSIRTATSAEWNRGRPDSPTEVNSEVKKELTDLREVLERQFANEDSIGGLFDILLDADFGNQRRIGVLRAEHHALLAELDAIIERMRRDGTSFDHRPGLAKLMRAVTQHDGDGAFLLVDTMTRDVGGEG